MTEWSDEAVDAMMRKAGDRAAGSDSGSGEHVDDAVLIAYRDRRLDEPNIAAVEKHLASCSDCRLLLESLHAPVSAELEQWVRGTMQRPDTGQQHPDTGRHHPDTGRRRPDTRRRILVAALAAAAAVALAFAFLPAIDATRNSAPLDYEARGPFGGVETMRGTRSESGRFVPSSRIELLFAPRRSAAGRDERPGSSLFTPAAVCGAPMDGPVTLWIFTRGPEGRLRPAPASAITRGEGGTFRFELEAAQLFGDQFGSRAIIGVLVPGTDATTREIREDELCRLFPAAVWFSFAVEYSASTEGELLK